MIWVPAQTFERMISYDNSYESKISEMSGDETNIHLTIIEGGANSSGFYYITECFFLRMGVKIEMGTE